MIPPSELDAESRTTLVRRANRSMARLSGKVSPVYPVASLLLGLSASLHLRRPLPFLALIAVLAVLTVARLGLHSGFDRHYDRDPGRWRRTLAGSVVASGGLWGLTLLWVLAETGLNGATILGLLLSTVMTCFSLNILTPDRALTRAFVSVVLLPTAVGLALTGGGTEALVALFVLPYGFQLWILSRRLNREYWLQAIQSEVSVLRAAELERERDRLQKIRRHLETEVEKREADYRRIFEGAHDAIMILDPEDETVLDANQRACDVYGFSRSELVGMSMLDISKDRRQGRKLIERTLARGTAYRFETSQFHRDGREIILEVSASGIEYQRRPAILSINRDVTHRVLADRELERHRRHLEELFTERTADLQKALATLKEQNADLEAKAAELERFTYTISHDLKSPLITIRGFLGMLESDLAAGDGERARKDMARIHAAASKMAKLLDELLELARIGRMINPPEPVALGDLAREAVELLDAAIEARAVTVDVADDLPVVRGDRVRLLEVYQNLIENAVRFMGAQQAPKVEVGVQNGDDGSVFFVRDNGIGIDRRYHDKVFGLFERLDHRLEGGTGVGLALVRRIIELHQGRIWVESEGIGKGSTFFFTLPGAQDRPSGPEGAATPQ